MKKREPRVKVLVRARMRTRSGWGDVTIHNMSSRGLLAATDEPCKPGTIVEIRRIHHIVVGRVVWQSDGYFGIRTQDPIDIQGIVSAKPPAEKPQRGDAPTMDDRRAARRVPAAEREAQSRRFAAAFQYVVLILAIGTAAIFAAQYVGSVLSRPFAQVNATLGGGSASEGSAPSQ